MYDHFEGVFNEIKPTQLIVLFNENKISRSGHGPLSIANIR